MYGRVFSSILGLSRQDARGAPFPCDDQTRLQTLPSVPRRHKCCLKTAILSFRFLMVTRVNKNVLYLPGTKVNEPLCQSLCQQSLLETG